MRMIALPILNKFFLDLELGEARDILAGESEFGFSEEGRNEVGVRILVRGGMLGKRGSYRYEVHATRNSNTICVHSWVLGYHIRRSPYRKDERVVDVHDFGKT